MDPDERMFFLFAALMILVPILVVCGTALAITWMITK